MLFGASPIHDVDFTHYSNPFRFYRSEMGSPHILAIFAICFWKKNNNKSFAQSEIKLKQNNETV